MLVSTDYLGHHVVQYGWVELIVRHLQVRYDLWKVNNMLPRVTKKETSVYFGACSESSFARWTLPAAVPWLRSNIVVKSCEVSLIACASLPERDLPRQFLSKYRFGQHGRRPGCSSGCSPGRSSGRRLGTLEAREAPGCRSMSVDVAGGYGPLL